jgi:colanic acid/amylovoran biosynthesis glycosyltransferase
MNESLAIFAPYIGALSETFIRRHMQELLPRKTVVVAITDSKPVGGHWSVDGPALVLDRIPSDSKKREVLRAISAKIGMRSALRPRSEVEVVRQFLRAHKVGVILGEYLDLALPWLPLAKELGIPFFAYALGYDVSGKLRDPVWQKEYLRYKEADGIIAVSNLARHRLIELGLEPTHIHVVACGADVPDKPFMRSEKPGIRCLAVGRMTAKKGPVLTLEAFRRAAQIRPDLHLDYIGDGELLPAAQEFIRTFNLQDRVTMHGGQLAEVVQQFLKKADIFLQHSIKDLQTGDEEGLPVIILEAMAQSLPVISTRHAAIPEAVLEGRTGYLVDEGDSIGMSEYILKLAQNADLRRQLGKAGWERARDHFSWDKGRAKLLSILGLPT